MHRLSIGIGISSGIGISLGIGISTGIGISIGIGISVGIGISTGIGISIGIALLCWADFGVVSLTFSSHPQEGWCPNGIGQGLLGVGDVRRRK